MLNGEQVEAISCGDGFTLILLEDGRLYSFGENSYGQLGIGYTIDSIGPIPSKLTPDIKYVKLFCGSDYTLCAGTKGKMYEEIQFKSTDPLNKTKTLKRHKTNLHKKRKKTTKKKEPH